jgi:uncharacterized protein (TIGR02246 family)
VRSTPPEVADRTMAPCRARQCAIVPPGGAPGLQPRLPASRRGPSCAVARDDDADTTPEALLLDRIAVATADEARRAVDSVAALGADFLKLRNDPPPEALTELLRAARERGLPVAAHVPLPITVERLGQLEFASIEHGYIGVFDGRIASALEALAAAERLAVFRALAARDVAYTPTLITLKAARLTPDSVIRAVALDQAGRLDPRRAFVEPQLAEHWLRDLAGRPDETPIDWRGLYGSWARDVGTAQEAGVLLLAGSDPGAPMVFPGFALHEELATLVDDGGLTPIEALRAATLNPARFLGADSLGVVEPGRLADLVLLDANPLEDIRNTSRIRAVMLNGRYLDRAALDSLLAGAAAAATRESTESSGEVQRMDGSSDATANPAGLPGDSAAIRAAYATWFAALEQGDVGRGLEALAGDAEIVTPGGERLVGHDAIRNAIEPFLATHAEEIEWHLDILSIDADRARVRVREITKVWPCAGGAGFEVTGWHAGLLRRAGSRWVIIRDVGTLDGPPRPIAEDGQRRC